ncbi:hypothetical protein ACL02T_17780 [Pseudonocardia sp. RS010]|uniref:hypothetical protein n=1 Tax=Pseudonocardia sp. RS010 TaxID=3385979 RepID=UPI0039A0665B
MENLLGYAKQDLITGCDLDTGEAGRPVDLPRRTTPPGVGAPVNAATHSEIAAVLARRLAEGELGVLRGLPSLRPRVTGPAVRRKVDAVGRATPETTRDARRVGGLSSSHSWHERTRPRSDRSQTRLPERHICP